MKYPKNKPVRLKGKKLTDLYKKVLERDNYTCQDKCCPGGFPIDPPHHIVFKSQGGGDTEDNLITYCRHCHGLRHGVKYVFDGTVPF